MLDADHCIIASWRLIPMLDAYTASQTPGVTDSFIKLLISIGAISGEEFFHTLQVATVHVPLSTGPFIVSTAFPAVSIWNTYFGGGGLAYYLAH